VGRREKAPPGLQQPIKDFLGRLLKGLIRRFAPTWTAPTDMDPRAFSPVDTQRAFAVDRVTDYALHDPGFFVGVSPPETTMADLVLLPAEAWPKGFSHDHSFSFYTPDELLRQPELVSDLLEAVLPDCRLFGREQYVNGAYTQQVDDSDYGTAIYLQHKRTDAATVQLTYQDRRVPVTMPSLDFLGGSQTLFEAFTTTFGYEFPQFDEALWEDCLEEHVAALMAKGERQLERISYRNSPDSDPAVAEVFLKGQAVTKVGKAFADARKGQMITANNTHVNMRFGMGARYVARMLVKLAHPNLILNFGLTLDELADKFESLWDYSKPAFCDDYTSFDGSIDEAFTGFFVLLFNAMGLPPDWIDDFVEWHASLVVLGGPVGHMIPSGFVFTWVLNTVSGMAFSALKYRMRPYVLGQPNVTRAYSGDDATHNEVLCVRPCYYAMESTFILKSTGYVSDFPVFCSNIGVPGGFFAEPTNHLCRVLFRLRRGSLATCVQAYAEHTYQLQRNYEQISQYLTPTQRAAHSLSFRLLRAALRLYGFPTRGAFFTKLVAHFYLL
jgi:hypothetical protein